MYRVRKATKMRLHLISFKVVVQSEFYTKNKEMYPYSARENTCNGLFHIPIKNIVKYIFSTVLFLTYNKTMFLHIEIQKYPYKLMKI